MEFKQLNKLIEALDIKTISNERKISLDVLKLYIQSKKDKHQDINLNFICTHNSRRSIDKLSEENNPVYAVKFSDNNNPLICFSKKFDAEFNPTSNFAAVMTCSHADENCPFIAGAEQRIPVRYDDPKAFDNTSQQSEKYQERSLQIATEMKYIFSNIS